MNTLALDLGTKCTCGTDTGGLLEHAESCPLGFWSCVIPGKPRTKNRKHAVWKPGMKHARLIDDPATKEAEDTACAFLVPHRPPEPFAGPLVQDVDFVFAIPKARAKDVKHKDGTTTKALKPGDLHSERPDRGNLLKLLDDAMKSARIIADDSLLADGRVRKLWGERDETRVVVKRADVGGGG